MIIFFLFNVVIQASLWIQTSDGVNTQSIRLATEYQLKRARDYIQDNYEYIINSGENYAGCDVYDMCSYPISLYGDSSEVISPWYTSGTAWHPPQCNASKTIIGVRPNNHDPDTGEELTEDTCPEYDPYAGCGFDNSLTKTAIKIPDGLDTTSQDFKDATCFTNDLESIWTTQIYSNCDSDEECWNSTNTDAKCLSYGVCSNTATPEEGSFAPEYIEYQYFGDQRTGVFAQVPATYWDGFDVGLCPGTYDPRFRPWYAGAASGPKDMILILDVSGSMNYATDSGSTRISVMQEAAIAVLDTLTQYDYATVVAFNHEADSYSSTLVPISEANRCELQNYIDDLTPGGGTNYEVAFEEAYTIMADSISAGSYSGCSAQVILFLTDGDIRQGDTDIVGVIDTLKNDVNNEGIDFKILTYGIGDDLEQSHLDKLKNISCNNNGIYYEIEDIDDSLANTMASYYQLFVSVRQTSLENNDTWVVWIDYYDYLTGYRLISANIAIYDTTTNPYTLLGIAVNDVAAERIINSTASDWGDDVGIYDDFDSVFADMKATAKQCPKLNFEYDELESIRASIENSETCSDYNTNTNDNSGSDDNDDSMVIILAIVIPLAVILLIIIIVCMCRQKKEKEKSRNDKKPRNTEEGIPMQAAAPSAPYAYAPTYR